jgi:hypothetical protein
MVVPVCPVNLNTVVLPEHTEEASAEVVPPTETGLIVTAEIVLVTDPQVPVTTQ